jgi:hypothetical protein
MRIRQRVQTSHQRSCQIFLSYGALRAQPDHARGKRKDIPDAVAHFVGQRLLDPQGLAEPFFRLDHAQRDGCKRREVAHRARMAGIEMSGLFTDDPQSAERRCAFALQRHQEQL